MSGLWNNRLLKQMTNLTFLEVFEYSYRAEAVHLKDLKRLALKMPSSLRHLNSCSVELVRALPRKIAAGLQTVCLSFDSSEERILDSLEWLFQKFGSRIKHLKIIYDVDTQSDEQSEGWPDALCDWPLEELTIEALKDGDDVAIADLPVLPATLKQLCVTGLRYLGHEWIDPAADSLESLHASGIYYELSLDMPTLPNLKELCIGDVRIIDNAFKEDENLLQSYWPNLNKFEQVGEDIELPPGIWNLSSLRFVDIFDSYGEENCLDMNQVSPLLEVLECTLSGGTIIGHPPLMKNLCKLNISAADISLSKGAFQNMPALKNLSFHGNYEWYGDCGDCEGVGLAELLPLCHTLTDLKISFVDDEEDQELLCQFTRLKRLSIWSIDEPLKLSNLPHSIKVLYIAGGTIRDLPLLPNLKRLHIFDDSKEAASDILQDCKGKRFEKLTHFTLQARNSHVTETFFRVLEIFPNIEFLKMHHSIFETFADFPVQLLSFLKQAQLGRRLEKIRIEPGLKRVNFNENAEDAIEELETLGVELYFE